MKITLDEMVGLFVKEAEKRGVVAVVGELMQEGHREAVGVLIRKPDEDAKYALIVYKGLITGGITVDMYMDGEEKSILSCLVFEGVEQAAVELIVGGLL